MGWVGLPSLLRLAKLKPVALLPLHNHSSSGGVAFDIFVVTHPCAVLSSRFAESPPMHNHYLHPA